MAAHAKLGVLSSGRLDKICQHPGSVSVCARARVCLNEVLMTVLRGPSQLQISVFILLWNSLWMLTI